MMLTKGMITGRSDRLGLSALQGISGHGSHISAVRDSLDRIKRMIETTDHALAEYVQVQKMESLAPFVRGIAHDLKSALHIISLNADQLAKRYGREFPEVNTRAESISRVAHDIAGLVDRLNTLGGETPEELLPRDFSIEVRRAYESLKGILPESGDIKPHFTTPSRPLTVLLGAGDTWQIVSNLVTNAVEAMPDGGDLLIGTSLRMVDERYCREHGNARTGQFAVLSVSDHGHGMDAETVTRIFDPLFSTKAPKEEVKRGWGLATLYALVSKRGGWIDVSSRPGEGSTFEVFLPVVGRE